jgi:hypothetical protein
MTNPLLSAFSLLRRNHALEHATLNILHEKDAKRLLAGYSNPFGFWIFGDLSTDELTAAVADAEKRLRAGESALAISPNCGTNFAATGIVAGSAAWIATATAGSGFRRKLDRLPLVLLLTTFLLIFTRPLGPFLQARLTTLADLENLKVTAVTRYPDRKPVTHQVRTSAS